MKVFLLKVLICLWVIIAAILYFPMGVLSKVLQLFNYTNRIMAGVCHYLKEQK